MAGSACLREAVVHGGKAPGFGPSIRMLVLPLIIGMNFGKSLSLSEPSFLICKMRIYILSLEIIVLNESHI